MRHDKDKYLSDNGLYVDTRLGGIPRYYLTPREDFGMRVPDEIRQSVVFLGVWKVKEGCQFLSLRGTAFFVSVPAEDGSSMRFFYLVTARHTVRELRGQDLVIRANTRDGRSQSLPDGGPRRWWYHTDDSVDVAVTNFGLPTEIFEYTSIHVEMFLSDQIIQEHKIGAGDTVFATGLFTHVTGNMQNLPVVRMGNIAMMPTERVPIEDSGTIKTIEAYLVEMHSIGGLSGCPVFVQGSVDILPGASFGLYLLGSLRGHWNIPKTKGVLEDINMGIAMVVPAKKILEILNHPELVAMRQRVDLAVKV